MADVQDPQEEVSSGTKKAGKSRRELPAGAVATLKAWLLSPEHFTHPYPTPQDQLMLMQKTGIDKKQLKNWFTNARRRIWKPMLKKQLEQGKITQTGTGVTVAISGATPSGLIQTPAGAPDYGNPSPQIVDHAQSMQQNYQNALQQSNVATQQQQQQPQQQQPQQQTFDQFGNPTFPSQSSTPTPSQNQYNNTSYGFQQGQYNPQQQQQQSETIGSSNSIASLPHMPGATPPGSSSNLNKTDSHAVLMELFARDQDLVRQATKERNALNGGGGMIMNQNGMDGNQDGGTSNIYNSNQPGSQHPMNSKITGGSSLSQNKLGSVSSTISWPHFSSVSSLNNLNTMTGYKSITNMSGADLVSQGSLNKKGNLAKVKSIETMGRGDSYAFLEVFFGDPGTGSTQLNRGVKRERVEDENIGLSLDGDEGTSPTAPTTSTSGAPMDGTLNKTNPTPAAAPLVSDTQDTKGPLKRAYDDALAARGLISVSRSSEKLTDLALPAKMQRTISQEYLKSMNAGGSTTFTTFSFNSSISQSPPVPAPVSAAVESRENNPAPLMHPAASQPFPSQTPPQNNFESNPAPCASSTSSVPRSSDANDQVEVPATTKCALCGMTNVDTQLRPCGHMFHGRCLKPSMQNAVGAPQCPIDKITMLSAVLAVPTDDNKNICNPAP